MKKKTLILGIETSCDETAAAVIEENTGTIPQYFIKCSFEPNRSS